MWSLILLLISLVAIGLLAFTRLYVVISRGHRRPAQRPGGSSRHLLIVLGSGGHTAEMLAMLDKAVFGTGEIVRSSTAASGCRTAKLLDWSKFTRRTWVTSEGDAFSALRAAEFEAKAETHSPKRNGESSSRPSFNIVSVPRARRVHQPLWSAPLSSLQCALSCIAVLISTSAPNAIYSPSDLPDVILTNGPATATILIFTSILLRFFNIRGCNSKDKMRTIYVESWARVKALSLSGHLLCHFVDRFVVQWEDLETKAARAEYHGVLCY